MTFTGSCRNLLTTGPELNPASCLKQSAARTPTPGLHPLLLTHMTHFAKCKHTGARTHTHTEPEILYNQEFWGMKERLVNILQAAFLARLTELTSVRSRLAIREATRRSSRQEV